MPVAAWINQFPCLGIDIGLKASCQWRILRGLTGFFRSCAHYIRMFARILLAHLCKFLGRGAVFARSRSSASRAPAIWTIPAVHTELNAVRLAADFANRSHFTSTVRALKLISVYGLKFTTAYAANFSIHISSSRHSIRFRVVLRPVLRNARKRSGDQHRINTCVFIANQRACLLPGRVHNCVITYQFKSRWNSIRIDK